jgi:hypothetical protein
MYPESNILPKQHTRDPAYAEDLQGEMIDSKFDENWSFSQSYMAE